MYISTQHVYILFAQGSIKVAKVNELTLILDRSTLTFSQVEFITKLFFFILFASGG
jgi:hypothetical protein